MHRVVMRLQELRERFWVLPGIAIVTATLLGLVLPGLDERITVPDAIAMSADEDTARSVLGGIVALGVSIAGVSFSILAVALVLASQQLSPRVLRSFQGQGLNQAVLAFLLGSATYALFVLGQISDDASKPVPELSVMLAMAFAVAALTLFVVFLHHAIRSFNASTVIRRIAADGHLAIAEPYPQGVGRPPDDPDEAERALERARDGDVVEARAPRAGYVASVDGHGLLSWARRNEAFVVQRRSIGDFAVTGSVLAEVWVADGAPDVDPVSSAFVLQEERVVDGDIAFPIRQLADIALKGLSPGINDPTTSENAMDSLTDTLARFATRPALDALRVDEDGVPRLRARVATVDALVRLGFDQVRRDAASRPSFSVRLLELLADLRDSAGDSAEIGRQARLIAEHAASAAEHEADQRLVLDAYERLHAGRAFADSAA